MVLLDHKSCILGDKNACFSGTQTLYSQIHWLRPPKRGKSASSYVSSTNAEMEDLTRTRREQTRSALLLATPLNHKGGQKPWFGLTARRRPAHEGDICAPTIGNTGGRPHERTKTEPVSRTRQPNLSAEPDSPNPTARTRQPDSPNPTTRQPDSPNPTTRQAEAVGFVNPTARGCRVRCRVRCRVPFLSVCLRFTQERTKRTRTRQPDSHFSLKDFLFL